jgi:cation diffusion facilitator family transporter
MSDTAARGSTPPKNYLRMRLTAIGLSFVIGAALMAAKFYTYTLTGSSAVLSDALESIINVVASAFALASILFSAKPPDESHPFGHGKVEYFSAGFEGALIILAALGIFKTGITHLLDPHPLSRLDLGLLILLGTSIVNCLLGIGLIRTGRKTRSLALIADGKHVLTDVITSVGVLVGLVLVHFTGWLWLDGGVACLVGVHILISGGKLVREAVSGLMDKTDPEVVDEIADILIRNRRDVWIDVHRLRVMRAGAHIHVDFHLILPRDLILEDAHRESNVAEALIRDHYQGEASVLIHLDPCMDEVCPVCANDPCKLRNGENGTTIPWTRKSLTMSGEAKKRLAVVEE